MQNLFESFLYRVRDFRSRRLFKALKTYCHGEVLDVGGGDFYSTVRAKQIPFLTWTTLEPLPKVGRPEDEKHRIVSGDGCHIPFPEKQFDCVVNVQVLEHVFEPLKMVSEMARVLKPSGYAILLIPQTATIHLAPAHFYNFTQFWVRRAMEVNHLELVELLPLGGFWSSMASRLVYFFFQSVRAKGMTVPDSKRNAFFYILYPLMVAYALVSVPICLILSLGDLIEEPNNHLVVVRKPAI